MLKFISILAFIGIWYIYFKETRKISTVDPPEYNLIITFDSKHYTDITWYEILQNYSRWEKCGRYSFRGHIHEEQLDEFSQNIEKELEISPDDYQVDFYKNDGMMGDYLIIFKDIQRPSIEKFPHLEILGRWTEQGKNNYRVWASISKETLKQAIEQELNIKESEFIVHQTASFAWTRFL